MKSKLSSWGITLYGFGILFVVVGIILFAINFFLGQWSDGVIPFAFALIAFGIVLFFNSSLINSIANIEKSVSSISKTLKRMETTFDHDSADDYEDDFD